MSKIAILSDIHSNTAALKVVLDHLDQEEVKTIYCLGDLVGYNADASKCLEMLRERNVTTILCVAAA